MHRGPDTPAARYALDYGRQRWPVLALWWAVDGACACPRGLACPSPAKHPLTAHGLDDATTDESIIRGWFGRWPQANIGLRTGIAFDVLDLDSPTAGPELAMIAHRAGEDTRECWAWGPMSITAKGSHLLYAPTGAGNRAGIVPGADWRGRGGYVVAPPSMHVSGVRYAWHPDCGPDSPIPPAPPSLLNLVLPPAPTPRPTDSDRAGNRAPASGSSWNAAGLIGRVAAASEGERNATLNWAANRVGADVRAGRVDVSEALEALELLAVAAERAGLTTAEVDATIRSGYTAGRSGRTGGRVA